MQVRLLSLKSFLGRFALVAALGTGLGTAYATSTTAQEASAEDFTCLTMCNVQLNPSAEAKVQCRPGGEWLCGAAFPRLMEGWF